jgi:hypothetical protein
MLLGFHAALEMAVNDGYLREDLCTNLEVAQKYGFGADQFMKESYVGATHSTNYDLHSIMHYFSETFVDPGWYDYYERDPNYLPLLAKTYPETVPHHPDNVYHVKIDQQSPPQISELDREAIKFLYP